MKRNLSTSSSSASFITADDESEKQTDRNPATLTKGVSPPPTRQRVNASTKPQAGEKATAPSAEPTTAQVEAGVSDVGDHVAFFSSKLASYSRPPSAAPRLTHSSWLDLYHRNESTNGHHFVIHQHDHPVAGTHYDLRLQINATSSMSFAIMYGLPGDPNSKRLNRNATETRVHCLWNHLIETASPQTGTLLIWDTGEYEILTKPQKMNSNSGTDSESDNTYPTGSSRSTLSEPEKLALAFSHRKVRLRLHGTRLPPGYTIYLRLTKDNDRTSQPRAPAFKRRRKTVEQTTAQHLRRASTTSSPNSSQPGSTSEQDTDLSTATRTPTHRRLRRTVSSLKRTASPPRRNKPSQLSKLESMASETSTHARPAHPPPATHAIHPPDNEKATAAAVAAASDESSDETIRLNNAYPGASNTVGSIHQRKWYLSLDRELSGFTPIPTPGAIDHHAKTYWVPQGQATGVQKRSKDHVGAARGATGFERFHVQGREHERSVVTGRLAADILEDEGVQGYVPRGRWRAVIE